MENNVSLLRVDFADERLPKFTEGKTDDDYVKFGEDNLFPQHLIDLFNQSGKNNAIITGVAEMIVGGGFMVKDNAPNLDNFLENPNPFETLNDILQKVALDLKLFGGFYLNCVWSRSGDRVVQLFHTPFETVRVNGKGTKFYVSGKWSNFSNGRDAIVFNAFNPLDESRKTKSQIFYYKQYRPGLKYYPAPDYIGARQYIETDAEISNFHFNNIKNSFSNSTVITFFNGEPTEEAKASIVAKLKGQKTGTSNAGGLIVNFVDKKEQSPEIARLQPDDMDKQYLQLYETVSNEIFIGHRITNPSIFGVKEAGQLGSRQDLVDSREMFYRDYVKPKVEIIERAFNFLLKYIVKGGTVYIEKNTSEDNEAQPVTPTAPVAIQQAKQLTEEDVLMMFDAVGEDANNYVVIKQKRLRFESDVNDELLINYKAAYAIDIEVTDNQKKILSAIKENPSLNMAQIANITGIDAGEVADALDALTEAKVIEANGEGYDITDAGLKTVEEKDLVTTEIFVKYKYDGPVDDRNRPFCAKVMEKNRLYTRADIDAVSKAAGYDVWKQRGGWYHNPKTDVNTPYCRHFWSQVLVKKKRK